MWETERRRIGPANVRALIVVSGAALLFGWMAAAAGQRSGETGQPGMTVLRDIEYVPGGHERQKLDLYLPKRPRSNEDATRRPLIVWVHGGAWLGGSKDRCRAVLFVRQGYAAASINYRLSQHAIFPAQIQDCKAAIRWLRAHADEYGWDPERIGVWGASAGGHPCLLSFRPEHTLAFCHFDRSAAEWRNLVTDVRRVPFSCGTLRTACSLVCLPESRLRTWQAPPSSEDFSISGFALQSK